MGKDEANLLTHWPSYLRLANSQGSYSLDFFYFDYLYNGDYCYRQPDLTYSTLTSPNLVYPYPFFFLTGSGNQISSDTFR